MTREAFKFVFLIIGAMLLQILVCNHIVLFDIATPIIFIYIIIGLPVSLNPSLLYTIAFLLGLCIDIFSDTPGVNALACTLLAALKKPVYFAYVDKDDHTKILSPSVASLGLVTYAKYLASMTGIYCLLVFSIEYFNFADVKEIVVISAASSLFSFLTLLAVDCLIKSKT